MKKKNKWANLYLGVLIGGLIFSPLVGYDNFKKGNRWTAAFDGALTCCYAMWLRSELKRRKLDKAVGE